MNCRFKIKVLKCLCRITNILFLKGLKRGIMEHSHLVVVNKADGDLLEAALIMKYEYTSALKFMRPISTNWKPRVLKISSRTKDGLPELWDVMQEFHKKMIQTGELFETRRKQQRIWMWSHITQHIIQVFIASYSLAQSFQLIYSLRKWIDLSE